MKMKKQTTSRFCFATLLGLLSILTATGQTQLVKYDLINLFENGKIETFNRTLSQFSENDKKGIRFSKNQGDGIAWLKGIEFSNGIIEVDIRGKDIMQQSFLGIAFHGIDNETLDAIYFRPFNFQSSDPVRKIHAVQYVAHPDFTWQVLREKHDGLYEKAVIPAPAGNDWFHAKIIIDYPTVTVYVNGNPEPSLVIEKLNVRKTGRIGLWVGNTSDGDFANLKITNK